MYEILSKSDFETGTSLIIKMPEADVDTKALYTISADRPNFLVPFRQRTVDGQIEFTYQIGNRSKITYLSGNKTNEEFIDLWCGLLQPLIDCWDWFLDPYSFVLIADYLYYDKNSKSICYIYVPSIKACSDLEALKSMVIEIEKENKVKDINLQNDVLRAIQDFKPKEFLQMLTSYRAGTGGSSFASVPVHFQAAAPVQAPMPQHIASPPVQQAAQPLPSVKPIAPITRAPAPPSASAPAPPLQAPGLPDDIVIDFSAKKDKGKKDKSKPKKEKAAKSKPTKEKPVKEKPAKKEKAGLFGKKKSGGQELVQGAAANSGQWQQPPIGQQHIGQPPDGQPQAFQPAPQMPLVNESDVTEEHNLTQLDVLGSDVSKLRYVGNGGHPRAIEVDIAENGVFTIGRFDASVGAQQSSFEFDKKTKAVSRRHAAVERRADGYYIVDLDSSAGTSLDGRKLPPNAAFKMENNSRISFGHSGADYVWEE